MNSQLIVSRTTCCYAVLYGNISIIIPIYNKRNARNRPIIKSIWSYDFEAMQRFFKRNLRCVNELDAAGYRKLSAYFQSERQVRVTRKKPNRVRSISFLSAITI